MFCNFQSMIDYLNEQVFTFCIVTYVACVCSCACVCQRRILCAVNIFFLACISSKNRQQKKVLLRERKRHTVRRVVSTHSVVLSWLTSCSPGWPPLPPADWPPGWHPPGWHPPADWPPWLTPPSWLTPQLTDPPGWPPHLTDPPAESADWPPPGWVGWLTPPPQGWVGWVTPP